MSTRYSLPKEARDADTARGARTLAAAVLVLTVLGLSLLAAVMPPAEPAMAATPDTEGPSTPAIAGA